MKLYTQTIFKKLTFFWLISVAFYWTEPIYAQQFSEITGLYFNGQETLNLKLKVFTAKSGSNGLISLSKGFRLYSGDKIEIPPKCAIQLRSQRGFQTILPTGNGPMLYTVKFVNKNEEHIVNGKGQIRSQVNKLTGQLGPSYKVSNGGGVSASSKATDYTFVNTDDDDKAVLKTDEGAIDILEEVSVKINDVSLKQKETGSKNEQKEGLTKSVTKTQSAGNEDTFGGETVEYDNYNEAIDALKQEVYKQEEMGADPEELADDFTTLGNLYIETGDAESAVEVYRKAAQYIKYEYEYFDMESLEIDLYLAEALQASGNEDYQAELQQLISQTISVLIENLNNNKDDFEFSNDDPEFQQIICEEILDLYDFLGWAYEISGNNPESDHYYNLSESGCN